MANNIVRVNVSQTIAPAPSTLQQTGALISQGATTTAVGTSTLLTQESDLTAILRTALAITSITWSGGTATVTTAAAHGLTVSDILPITIAGMAPTGYNGTYNCTITGSNTFTYALGVNPGSMVTAGTWILAAVAELTAMANTFFAQGSAVSVYVLELGAVETDAAVSVLDTFILDNEDDQVFYAYLTPRSWADSAAFLTFLADFEEPTSKTYFFVTVTLSNYGDLTATMKCVVAMVEAPAAPSAEFTLAAPFYRWLGYDPSTTNKVAPFSFAYLYGVTAYPVRGNSATLAALKNAAINYVGVGAEGGITNSVLFWGTTKDGNDATYWYSVDWVQINVDLDLANAVINGSNNPTNPLYYNQQGIDRLQAVAQLTMDRGTSFGLVNGTAVVQAVRFAQYVVLHPSDYSIGKYDGLSVSYTPSRGFTEIVFNLNVSQFPTQ
jgi:hypothetical protein